MSGGIEYSRSYLLAILTSVSFSFWSIFAYLAITMFGGVSFIIAQMLIAVIGFPVAWLFLFAHRSKFRPTSRLLKYAVLETITGSLGTTVYFYEFLNAPAFPLTASAASLSVFFFAFLVRKVNNSKVGAAYFAATAIVVIGLFLQGFSVSGAGFGLSTGYLLLLPVFVVLYGLGAFFAFKPMRENEEPFSYTILQWLVYILVMLVAVTALGAWGSAGNITPVYIVFVVLTALAGQAGFITQLYAFKTAKRAKASVINVINILIGLDIIGIFVFSVLFLPVLKIPLFAGTVLIVIGIVALMKMKK